MRPTNRIVRAFGRDPALLGRLDGGQGTSWRAGDIVLRPAELTASTGWLAEVLTKIPDSAAFRLARPVASNTGECVVDGWTATRRLAGRHLPGRWQEKLAVSAALHAALAAVDVAHPFRGDDPWAVGAHVAWRERPIPPGLGRSVSGWLRALQPSIDEPWPGPRAQLIHGDLGGNILHAEGLPPAVIDVSPLLAPAPFADAVIVADAVAWGGADADLARWFAATTPTGRQLLARAVVFRLVSIALLCPNDPARVDGEVAAYAPVAGLAV